MFNLGKQSLTSRIPLLELAKPIDAVKNPGALPGAPGGTPSTPPTRSPFEQFAGPPQVPDFADVLTRPDRGVFRPPREFPFPPLPPADPDIPRFSGDFTTTHLVTYALDYLESLDRETLQRAISFILAKPQKVNSPGELFEDLRQRTSFPEVLQEKAEGWKPLTRKVFSEVFAMPIDDLTAMDAIVLIALLSRSDLEQVLRNENAVPPSIQELMENRKIIWQYPPPGTPLTPPYVIIVAVEGVDTAPAADIVQQIISRLVPIPSGYRLPRLAAQKLS